MSLSLIRCYTLPVPSTGSPHCQYRQYLQRHCSNSCPVSTHFWSLTAQFSEPGPTSAQDAPNTDTPSSDGLLTQRPQRKPKPAFIISSKSISVLEDPKCPICWEPYSEVPSAGSKLPSGLEFPVSVDMVATQYGLRRCCGHIMGRKCLEKQLTMQGEWRNKCPLCRDEWCADRERASAGEPLRTEVRERSRSSAAERRGEEVMTLSRSPSEPRMSTLHGVGREQRRRRRRRLARFLPRLFATLNIRDGDLEVDGSVEDIEKLLQEMYRRLED